MILTLRFLIRRLIHLIARVDIHGKENVPLTGGMILAANHIGILDIVMVYFAIDRTDLFIPVAEKWEKIGWIRWLGRQLNFLFVDRYNPDLKAMRDATDEIMCQIGSMLPENYRGFYAHHPRLLELVAQQQA